eukprot:Em0007g204a
MSHCLRQVSTLSRTPLQRSYDTLALTSLRANMTVIGLMAAPKIQLKSVRSMQRNTPGLLDRRIGPKDMFIVLLYIVTTPHGCLLSLNAWKLGPTLRNIRTTLRSHSNDPDNR